MSAVTESLEKAILDLEREQAKIAAALTDLRLMLKRERNGGSPTTPQSSVGRESPNPSKPAFQRKYESNAPDLVWKILKESGKAMHIGEIRQALHARGYDFISATVRLSLAGFMKEGKVRRQKAPRGSGFSHAYALQQGVSSSPVSGD